MVSILIRAGGRVTALKISDSTELLGINNRVELAEADGILRARKVRQLMLDGVTIEKPETVTIDADVKIGIDTIVGPFAQITGATAIGDNCRIGACSIIHSATLGDGAEVFPFADGRAPGQEDARRQFRRAQEDDLRGWLEVDASGLSRRLDDRQQSECRGRDDHVQL